MLRWRSAASQAASTGRSSPLPHMFGYVQPESGQVLEQQASSANLRDARARTSIWALRWRTAASQAAITAPKMAAMMGSAAAMLPSASSSACAIQDAPDLPTCAASKRRQATTGTQA